MIDPYTYWMTSTKKEKNTILRKIVGSLCIIGLAIMALVGWGLYFDSQGSGFCCESGCLNMLEIEYGHPIPEAYHALYTKCSMMCRGVE
jgi:hypothetical protein